MQKSELLSILNKYGLDSKYHNLFLYEEGDNVGLMYSLSHPLYGLIQRIVSFSSLDKAEDFIYRYWWFKKYQKKFEVTMELDNYEKMNPKPMFFMYGRELTSKEMRTLLEDPEELPREQKRQKIYQRCIRTARILVAVMEEKIKIQNDTYRNVKDLNVEFQKQENEFIKLYNEYLKTNQPLNKIDEGMEEDINMKEEIETLNEQIDLLMNQKDLKVLKEFIDTLWKSLLNIEIEKGHLQNKYLLFKLPIDLEDVQKKKNYLKQISKKKRGFFSKKEPVLEELKKIDAQSEIHKLIKMKDFIQNETKRLKEKYSIIEEMDYVTLGDYLNEFDNLGIFSPLELLERPQDKKYMKEDIQKEFLSIYNSLSEKDVQCLSVYHSFLRPICDCLLSGILKGVFKNVVLKETKASYFNAITQALVILEDADNMMLRMRKMKVLSLRNEDTFLESLYQVCLNLRELKSFQISGVYYAFGKSMLSEYLEIYRASLKNVGIPVQSNKFDVNDIIEIKSGVSVLYSPYFYSVKDLIFHDYTVEEQKKEGILVFLKDYKVNLSNFDIIKVSRYQAKEKIENGIRIMYDMVLTKVDLYRHIVISK